MMNTRIPKTAIISNMIPVIGITKTTVVKLIY